VASKKSGDMPTFAVTITSFDEGSIYSNFGEEILEVAPTNYASYPGLGIGSVASLRSN
jgi:hypothetical protein